jgi:AcrR family transcriptional regulator
MASLPRALSTGPVGRQPLPREVINHHQRERVLMAATEIFAKRGYQATTVDHIVAGAGIGVGSFYSHFEGKENCFLCAYEEIVTGARERIAAEMPTDRPWPEQVSAALGVLLALIAARPFQARVALVEVQTAGPTATARHEATVEEAVQWMRLGRRLSTSGEELPDTLEAATVGGVLWFLQQRVVQGQFDGLEQHLQELAGVLLEPYLGEAETRRFITSPAATSSFG